MKRYPFWSLFFKRGQIRATRNIQELQGNFDSQSGKDLDEICFQTIFSFWGLEDWVTFPQPLISNPLVTCISIIRYFGYKRILILSCLRPPENDLTLFIEKKNHKKCFIIFHLQTKDRDMQISTRKCTVAFRTAQVSSWNMEIGQIRCLKYKSWVLNCSKWSFY